jgi:hypothetical protein
MGRKNSPRVGAFYKWRNCELRENRQAADFNQTLVAQQRSKFRGPEGLGVSRSAAPAGPLPKCIGVDRVTCRASMRRHASRQIASSLPRGGLSASDHVVTGGDGARNGH